MDEAPVLLAAVEDLLHVGQDARDLLLGRGRDDVVVDQLLDLVGSGVGLAKLDDEAHGPDVLRARELEGLGHGGHAMVPPSLFPSFGIQPASASRRAVSPICRGVNVRFWGPQAWTARTAAASSRACSRVATQ